MSDHPDVTIEIGRVRVTCTPCDASDLEINIPPRKLELGDYLRMDYKVDVTLKADAPGPEFYEGPMELDINGEKIKTTGTVRKEKA